MHRESQLKIESWMRHKGLGLMFRHCDPFSYV